MRRRLWLLAWTGVILAGSSGWGTTQKRLSTAAAFEEAGGGRAAYVWRGRSGEVQFGSAGTLRFASGAEAFQLRFAGANAQSEPQGEGKEDGEYSYYRGSDSAEWRLHLSRYRQIRYRGLYPGIDAVFRLTTEGLEYDLELAPHASAEKIRLRFQGVKPELKDGDLRLIPGVLFKRPEVYQMIEGRRVEVASSFERSADGGIVFHLGEYDRDGAVVIDPAVVFSGYYGGVGYDAGYATCVDSSGNIYIAGESDSYSFGSSSRRNIRNAFVAKLNTAGAVLNLVYLGSSGADSARGIAVDSSGGVYVTGTVGSSNFPTTAGTVSTHLNGQSDAFVLKLDASFNLVYSTLIGSTGVESGYGIAIDGSGNAYVAGSTTSLSFPGTSGRFSSTYAGGFSDCFVVKVNATAQTLTYATYLGGSGLDVCRGIAVDASGNAYVTGTTSSPNFPVVGPAQASIGGATDAFIVKINPTASALVYSSFWGGMSMEDGNAIAVDSSGSAYVTGSTASVGFPVTGGVFQSALKGMYNAFLVRLSNTGTIVFSTLIGGSGSDAATSLALNSAGQAVIAGYTSSADLPTQSALQPAWKGAFDGFIAVFSTLGNSLVYGSYLGGSGDDRVNAVAVGAGDIAYLAGTTSSSDFPNVTGSLAGGNDIFLHELHYATATTPTSGLVFIPLTPCRLVDTRGYPAFYGTPYLSAGAARSYSVIAATTCGVPSTAQAYSFNVTALPRTSTLGALTVWPTGQTQPPVSTIVALDGRVVASATFVAAGTGGAVSAIASNDTEMIIDINGYFDAPGATGGLAFYPLAPCRMVDTRGYSSGALSPAYLSAKVTRTLLLATAPGCVVPSNAQAYSLNFTALPRTNTLQFLSVWPSSKWYPNVSTLNSFNGQVDANAAVMPIGPSGGISLYANDDTELIVDINGLFAPSGSAGAMYFHPLPACRVADTRGLGITGALGPPSMESASIRAFPILSSSCGIPSTAVAFVLNATVYPPAGMDFLSMWPVGQPYPTVSTLNAYNGAVVSNLAIIPSGTGGAINIYVNNKTDVVLSTLGYFAP